MEKCGNMVTLIGVQDDMIDRVKRANDSLDLIRYSIETLIGEMGDCPDCVERLERERDLLYSYQRNLSETLLEAIRTTNGAIYRYTLWNPD